MTGSTTREMTSSEFNMLINQSATAVQKWLIFGLIITWSCLLRLFLLIVFIV